MVAANRNTITLKGSTKTITDFFGYAVNRFAAVQQYAACSMAHSMRRIHCCCASAATPGAHDL